MRKQFKVPTTSQVLVGVLMALCFSFPARLVDSAVTGWVDSKIADYFGWPSPSVSDVISFAWQWVLPFAAAALVLTLYHFVATNRFAALHVPRTDPLQRIKVDPILAVGLLVIVIGLIIFALRISILSSTRAVSGTFLSIGVEPEREGSPLAFNKALAFNSQKQTDGSVQIRTIGVLGKNIGTEEIQLDDAYLVSAVTGTRLNLKIAARQENQTSILVPIAATNPIPPGADVELRTDELSGTQGIQETDFLRDWGGIYLIVDYEGLKHRIVFSRKAIETFFEAQRPQPIPPHVTLKKQ